MKKILFVTPHLGIGGAQQHLILFANYLAARHYKVTIINTNLNNGLHDEFIDRISEGIDVVHFARRFNFDLSPAKEIEKYVMTNQIETVFCDSLFSYLYVIRALKNASLNVFLIFHATIYVDVYNYIKDLILRFLLKGSVKLIGVSENQVTHLSKVLSIPKDRFKVIYNGIDKEIFNYQLRLRFAELPLRKELGIPVNSFVIIKNARLNVEKNHEYAVEILEHLRSKYNINAYMIFVGKGLEDRLEKIKDLANKKRMLEYIKIVGYQKDVRPFLAISDLFILTSKSVETFSIAALEAMAMGLPVVLSDVGGANEMVFPGINGYVASSTSKSDFGEKIRMVYQKKLSLSTKGISEFILRKFDVEDTNRQLQDFIF